MRNSIYCLVSSEPEANSILQHLRNIGFLSTEVSVLLQRSHDTRNISLREDAVRGAETGGLLGVVVGWIAGLSAFTIPGIGAFVAAGPIVSAIGAGAVGGAVGALAGGSGAFARLGIPRNDMHRFEERLRQGAILIAVHSDDPRRRDKALRVFKSSGAEDICYPEERAA
jgi:hypothetical protein